MADRLRVLLIDCDPHESEQISSRLSGEYHSVIAAAGLEEASEWVELQRFDAVLVAQPFDGAAGAFAAKLRALDAGQRSAVRTPILSLADPSQSPAFPADGYLTPAFDAAALAAAVAGLTSSAASLGEPGTELPTFDFEKLRAQAGDDRELISEIVSLFLSDQQNQFDQMRCALDAGDYGQLSLIAHTVKGSFGTLGAMLCWSRAQQLEYAAKQRDESRCRGLLPSLETALRSLLPHLEALRSESSPV